MAAKAKNARAKSATNGKKNGAASASKKRGSKTTKRRKEPRNAEEATLLAWAETYEKRDKRFKIWENR